MYPATQEPFSLKLGIQQGYLVSLLLYDIIISIPSHYDKMRGIPYKRRDKIILYTNDVTAQKTQEEKLLETIKPIQQPMQKNWRLNESNNKLNNGIEQMFFKITQNKPYGTHQKLEFKNTHLHIIIQK